MSSESTLKSAGDTPFLLHKTEGPATPRAESPEKLESKQPAATEPPEITTTTTATTAAAAAAAAAATTPLPTKSTFSSQPRESTMEGSSHTEPSHRHSKDELMHPGRDHHLNSPPPCPDPSVHRDTKLQEQGASAALYSPPKSNKGELREGILDSNNKLSSRSAATSLKYARPEDLPSFPVVGINTTSSANAAANLANTNHKAFEHWKPDASSSASKAAMLAKDYKMAPLWKPEMSAAGSKAALLAHKDGGKLDLWMPKASADGHSAATLALAQKSTSPQLDYGYTEDGRKRAMMAATGAVSRSKSKSAAPPPVNHPAYPDSRNSVHNALNAATVANKQDSNRIDSDAMRAARVQNMTNVDRQMYTEHPPVAIEREEKMHADALRASSVSMAKQMYTLAEKRRKDDEAAGLTGGMGSSAATAVHGPTTSSSTAAPDMKQQALQYIHLQEAAQKLAQERLAKLEPDGAARYKMHYGYGEEPRSRYSLRGRPRRRADSETTAQTHTVKDDDDSSDDEFAARRVRNQMSGLSDSVAQIDAKKRASDRANLLAAAERKVQAQMNTMDEKVFQDTGKVSPAMMEQWEAKARARANADSEMRQKNYGKVNIGGGKYMDQSELEAIALSRLQPTLDQISSTAEKKRAIDEERRLEEEERKRVTMSQKEKDREVKNETKRLRAEEKAAAKSKRAEEKALEKSRKAEEKQAKRESKIRTQETKKEAAEVAAVSSAAHEEKAEEVAPRASTATEPIAATTSNEPVVATTSTERDVATPTTPVVVEPVDVSRVETNDSVGTMQSNNFSNPDGTMRPRVERQVTTVVTSSSSSNSSISSLSDSDDEAEQVHSPVSAVAMPVTAVHTVPVVPVTSPTTTTPAAGDHDAARQIAERVIAPPVEAESAAPETVITTGRQAELEEASLADNPKRKSKGFSGFFGKFKRGSQGQVQPGSFSTATKSSTSKTTPALGTAAVAGSSTTGAAPATTTTAAATAADVSDSASESSFRRHQTDLHSISSKSSSEDERRGRTGKLPSRNKKIADAAAAAADSDGDEFEEARDHFDEGLASPPLAAGHHRKGSSSPVRETKFQEEL